MRKTHTPYQCILLDRDGVINHDSDQYIKSPEEWIPIDGSLAAIAKLNHAGLPVGVATNQSGIGRGYYDEATLHAMHEKMANLLSEVNGRVDAIEFCPHHPDAGCDCRKPKPLMLEKLASQFGYSPAEILFVGDSKSDWECAKNFGCDFALVLTGKGERTREKLVNFPEEKTYKNLASLVDTCV